jgi:hypothetical protein
MPSWMLGMSMGDPQRYPHGTHEYYDHPQQMDMMCYVLFRYMTIGEL